MMKVVTTFASSIMLTAAAMFYSMAAHSETLTFDDPRPVAAAIEQLGNRFGWLITYEDPPYQHRTDVVDVTNSVRRDQNRAVDSRVWIPKSRPLSINLSNRDEADPRIAVQELVDSFNASQGYEIFAILQGNGLLHVVPTHVKKASGKTEPVRSILDASISISRKTRTVVELLEEICRQLSSQHNSQIFLASVPLRAFATQDTTVAGDAVEARVLLEQLVGESKTPFSWQILYDPGASLYGLNIDLLSKPQR